MNLSSGNVKNNDQTFRVMNENGLMDETVPISIAQIKMLTEFIPYFKTTKEYGCSVSEKLEDGSVTFPEMEYTEDFQLFIDALYSTSIMIVFDWSKWDEGRKIASDEKLIKASDLTTLRKLLFTVVRNERFCTGVLLGCAIDGFFLTILLRMQELINENSS